MAEEIKELLAKIRTEGIQAAEEKAGKIEEEARRQAEEIVARAKKEAQKMLAAAEEKIQRQEEYTRSTLAQAGRDVLLSLKREINAMLERLILAGARRALPPQELAKIIAAPIKDYRGQAKDIVVSLNEEDLEKIKQGLLEELKEAVKKGVTLKPSIEISAGFTISYDGGKSQFDFTDRALAEYIGAYIKPCLKDTLQAALEG
ncbi:MAG: hypothetical protein FJZ13_01915 [Candidatus Omnitrophica bacterium]|nr:hypothetical protein [Candidatus Omnitrophota bacterium]